MDALLISIRKPLTRGDVYPESYEYAFREWTAAERAGRHAPLCTTSIDRCLQADW
jgi:hypothetical protein